MLARIVFTSGYGYDGDNLLTVEELVKLEDFLGETVKVDEIIINSNGEKDTFKGYAHTYNSNDEDETLDLVSKTNLRKINSSDTYIVNLERFMNEFPKLEIKIKGVPKSVDSNYSDVMNMIEGVSEKIEKVYSKFDKQMEFNEVVNVHVPNLGLMNINKLAYATDYCTVQLQGLLDKGWRILSICPQPDQRRPDYILGMSVLGENDNIDVEHFIGDGGEKRE